MQTNATGTVLRIGSGVLAAGVGLGVALTWTGDSTAECPPGYVLYEESEREGRDKASASPRNTPNRLMSSSSDRPS